MNSQLPAKPRFQLKKLSAKHRQVAALLAQGLGRTEISRYVKVCPEYVTVLAQQPLFQDYVKKMTAFTDVRLGALFDKSVDVMANLMSSGSEDNKLRAAQSVLKAVGKDGSQEAKTVTHKFVVELPAKSASTEEWEKLHKPKRLPVTVDHEE